MTLGAFIVLVFVVVALCWIATWALGYFFPGHNPLFDKLIIGLGIFIVLWQLVAALGLLGYDPVIPKLRG
jgi:hypothetical protein